MHVYITLKSKLTQQSVTNYNNIDLCTIKDINSLLSENNIQYHKQYSYHNYYN